VQQYQFYHIVVVAGLMMQTVFAQCSHQGRHMAGRSWARAMSGVSTIRVQKDTKLDTPKFLKSLEIADKLPFEIPQHSWVHWGIGSTPMVKISDRIQAKLEGETPGGSLKDRTISSLVLNAFVDGRLKCKGDTLMLVTSGSAGYSLVKVKQALEAVRDLELDVIIVMPKAYAHKDTPAAIIALDGVRTFESAEALLNDRKVAGTGHARVLLGDGVFMEVMAESKKLAADQGWQMVDQHFDAHAVQGHKSTALEIMQQCPQVTDVVCSTGTGATAAGLMRFLPSHVKVHSRPAVSGSIDGLSNLERYDNFCDQTKLEGYDKGFFDKEVAEEMMQTLNEEMGMACGPSTGATYALARDIVKENPSATVVFICADGKMAKKAEPQRELPKAIPQIPQIPQVHPLFGVPCTPSSGVWLKPDQRTAATKHVFM